MVVDRLPLSANGKVDRRVLPEPEGRAELVHAPVEPRDELERQLVGIWQDILSVNPVGTRDSFFDLGGHSLLAVRMFVRLEKKLGATLPLAALFEAPTIEALAALIRKGTRPPSARSMDAFQQYEPRVYPAPVVLFCAEGRTVAPAADYRLAWRDFATGGLQVYSAPGDDSGLMLQEPHVRLLAAQLKMCIERARTSVAPPRRA